MLTCVLPLTAILPDGNLVLAADARPASWPTLGALLEKASPGEWCRYEQTQAAGGRAQSGTMWLTFEGKDAQQATIVAAITQKLDAPSAPPAQAGDGVQMQKQQSPLQGPLMSVPIPPGGKVVGDNITSRPYSNLAVGGRNYSGTHYERLMRLQLPGGVELNYKINLWLSPEVPVTQIVRQIAEVSGMMSMTSTMSLVTHSRADVQAAAPQAETVAEAAAVAFGNHRDLLAHSNEVAQQVWKVNNPGASLARNLASEAASYRYRVGRALLEMGSAEQAMKIYAEHQKQPVMIDLRNRLRAEYAKKEDRAKLAALGVPEADMPRTIVTAQVESLVQTGADDGFKPLLAIIQAQSDDRLRHTAVYSAIRMEGLTADQLRLLIAEIKGAEELNNLFNIILPNRVRYNGDLTFVDMLAQAHPPFGASPEYPLFRAMALAKLGKHEEAHPLIEDHLKASVNQPVRREAVETLKLLRDPRFATLHRQVAGEDYARWTARLKTDPSIAAERYAGEHLSTLAAALGDNAAAAAHLQAAKLNNLSDYAPAIVAMYSFSGSPDRAIAWCDELCRNAESQPTSRPFFVRAVKARIHLGTAEHEWHMGNDAGYQKWLALALEESIFANHELVAYNAGQTESNKRLYWPRATGKLTGDAPFAIVAQHLIERQTTAAHATLMRLLTSLKDEWPTSGAVKDTWRMAAVESGKQGNAAALKDVLAALPRGWEENWYTAIISESVRPIAADGDKLAWVREITALQEKPNWKAEILRSAIIAMAGGGGDHRRQIAELMTDMKAAVASGASSQHQAYAAIAQANHLAAYGQLAEARAAFADRTSDLREHFVMRGANGQHWMNYLYEMAEEIGRQANGDYDEAAAWFKAMKYPHEAAMMALGMARGYYGREYAR